MATQGFVYGTVTGTAGLLAGQGAVRTTNYLQDKAEVSHNSYGRRAINFIAGGLAGYGGAKLAGQAVDAVNEYITPLPNQADANSNENVTPALKNDEDFVEALDEQPWAKDNAKQGLKASTPTQDKVDLFDNDPYGVNNKKPWLSRQMLSVKHETQQPTSEEAHVRTRRETEECFDMDAYQASEDGIPKNRKWFSPLRHGTVDVNCLGNSYQDDPFQIASKPVRVVTTDCTLIHQSSAFRSERRLYATAVNPVSVECEGGGVGLKFDGCVSEFDPYRNITDVSMRCTPPASRAYDCKTEVELPVPSNGVINVNDIPLGAFNQALPTSSNAMVTDGNNTVPWSDFYSRVASREGHARCEGAHQGQPNVEFITREALLADFESIYACRYGTRTGHNNAENRNVVNLDDINVEDLDLALVETAPDVAIVTDGKNSIPWADFKRSVEILNPNALCKGGAVNGNSYYDEEVNAGFLTREKLYAAFRRCADPETLDDANYQPITIEDINDINDIEDGQGLNIPDGALVSAGGSEISYWRDVKPHLISCSNGDQQGNIKKIDAAQLQQAVQAAPKALDRICYIANRTTPVIYGNVVHINDLQTVFNAGQTVHLAPNDLVFDGTNHTLWQDVHNGFDYHNSSCIREQNAWRNVDNATLLSSIQNATAVEFPNGECGIRVNAFDIGNKTISANNISKIFTESYPAWGNIGLVIADGQAIALSNMK